MIVEDGVEFRSSLGGSTARTSTCSATTCAGPVAVALLLAGAMRSARFPACTNVVELAVTGAGVAMNPLGSPLARSGPARRVRVTASPERVGPAKRWPTRSEVWANAPAGRNSAGQETRRN